MFGNIQIKKRNNVARSRVSRFLQTISRYESRDKYRDTSMNRANTKMHQNRNAALHCIERNKRQIFIYTVFGLIFS